jgi:DNA segregation ATPase FtsK/SpoIIIE, S-DNA-T family
VPLFLGKNSSGESLVSDLAEMPHCLIAGTTGSGKSVCINTIIISILMTRRPDEVKLILIDPKMVEMASFESIPHLMCPTVTEMRRAEQILEWAVEEMDKRYELLKEAQVRNIASYNLLTAEELIARFEPTSPQEEALIPKKLPHLVIIIDELADLMMTSGKEVESYIVRIAQKSRAVGIHLILATQRPERNVVTGLIKSNMPARIAFRVASGMDSRIILDSKGAESLLGKGDMLFLKPGTSELMRAQGAFLDDDEIRRVVQFLKTVAEPQYSRELMQLNKVDLSAGKTDDMFDEAVRIVLETQRGSVSLLQRRLGIGYARASRIIETMGQTGLLGAYKGSQAREVVMTLEEYEAMKKNMIADEVAGYADLTAEEADDEYEDDDIDEVEDEEYDEEAEDDDEDGEEEEDDEDGDEDDEYLEATEYLDEDEAR